ncbi:MAG: hypothetical protein ACC707_10600, partial [Thiohalomonadales bacterium]
DTQLLPGNYRLVAATKTSSGKSVDFSLDVLIDGVAQTQINGAWISSAQSNPYSPTNPRFPLVLTKNSHVSATLSSRVPVQLFLIGAGEQKITTFYTFAADGSRLTEVDLDGRGAKLQPGVCVPCHGGNPKALLANGDYPDQGDIGASFIAWDLDLFDYADNNSNYTRDAQESIFKQFNKTVLAHRLMPALAATENYEPARNTVIKGWYGGADLPQEKFDGNFIPALWLPDSKTGLVNNVVDGADDLYLQVVRPTCRVCHLQQGGIMFPASSAPEKALAFGSHAGFMAYQKEIEEAIYDKSTMPLALRTFVKFWRTGQAELLATQLPNFSHYKDAALQAEISVPGRPIADAGVSPLTGNRIVPVGELVVLNGSASIFADSHLWRVVSKPVASKSTDILTNEANEKAEFRPDVVGAYQFELTVVNARGESSSSISLDADVAANVFPVSFANDIKPIAPGADYQERAMKDCIKCHTSRQNRYNYTFGGYYNQFSQINAEFIVDFSGADVYKNVRGLVNLDRPHHSPFLQKPSHKLWHGGGTEYGYKAWEANKNKKNYDLVLRWILEGAKDN